MNLSAAAATDIGQKREQNEDAFLIDDELGLFIVCDGMGGHACGEVASMKAAEFAAEFVRQRDSILTEAHEVPGGYYQVLELAEDATEAACEQLYQMAAGNREFAGMGTTFTMVIVVDNKAVMAHVGDSRLYLLRQGEVHLLSNDHTLANEMLQRGVITPEQLEGSRYRNIVTRSLGNQEAVECEMLMFDVLPGDTLLLCSDGLSNYFQDDEEIAEHLQQSDLECIPRQLVELANLRGGRDNITAIVIRAAAPSLSVEVKARKIADFKLKLETLRTTFLGRSLSYSRLVRLLEIAEVKSYDRSADVLAANSDCEGLYIVLEGGVSLSRVSGPPVELGAGQSFGETGLVRERKAHSVVQATDSARILLIRRAEFKRLASRMPKLGRVLYAKLLDRLSERLDAAAPLV